MGLLWARPEEELTGRDIADDLPDYAYTTVATILDRLAQKEVVRRRKDGRVIRFSASGSPATHTALLMHRLLDSATDESDALAEFVRSLAEPEVAVLRDALGRRRREG